MVKSATTSFDDPRIWLRVELELDLPMLVQDIDVQPAALLESTSAPAGCNLQGPERLLTGVQAIGHVVVHPAAAWSLHISGKVLQRGLDTDMELRLAPAQALIAVLAQAALFMGGPNAASGLFGSLGLASTGVSPKGRIRKRCGFAWALPTAWAMWA